MTAHPNRNWRARLARAAQSLGPDLMAAWISVMDRRPSELAQYLEAETGVRYTLHRLGEWRNGRRRIPMPVAWIMRRDVCRHLLASDELGSLLCESLTEREYD